MAEAKAAKTTFAGVRKLAAPAKLDEDKSALRGTAEPLGQLTGAQKVTRHETLDRNHIELASAAVCVYVCAHVCACVCARVCARELREAMCRSLFSNLA